MSTETILSEQPFIVRRIARWEDCDPAGVVFTGKFCEYLLAAVMSFMRQIGYGTGQARSDQSPLGLPCKHMNVTFHVSVYPEDVLDIHLSVSQIRSKTFDLQLHAYLEDGRLAFEGQFTPIVIRPDARESQPIPDDLRQTLTRYLPGGTGAQA